MIAAQSLLHPQRSLIGAGVSVGRAGFGVQRDLGIEVNGAFGAKPGTVPRDRCMTGIAAVEIFVQGFADPHVDTLAQRVTDVEILP